MKAKDTVIRLEERILTDYPDLDACLEAQAEISFEAGYEAHKNEACSNCDTPLIREVELYQKLDKERQIQDSLVSKEYREALAIEHVNTTLAIQIRKMRENHQWSQSDLANRLGKHQETLSQWENPDYGRQSITTLKALAAIFDVALLVKFIPFSELVEDMVSLSETRLSPPSFSEERKIAHEGKDI